VLPEVIRELHVTIAQGLGSFASFYERILPYRIASSWRRLSKYPGPRSGLPRGQWDARHELRLFDHRDENVERCFELIELRSRQGSLKKILGDYQAGFVRTEELLEALARSRGEEVPQLNERGRQTVCATGFAKGSAEERVRRPAAGTVSLESRTRLRELRPPIGFIGRAVTPR
jgi:hypothetical protein